MANLKVKMSLDAAGYTSGIKQANEATKEFTNQITQSTKSLPNAKKQMMQVKREAQNLAVAINMMSDAERSSAEGQAMIRHLNELRERGAVLIDTIGDINAEMRAMASDTSGLDAAGQAIGVFGNTLSSVAGIIGLVTGEEDKMKQAVVAFTTVQSVLNTITQISNALNKSSILVLKTKAIQQKLATVATKLETAAQAQNIIVTKAATIATKAFNAVVKANPIGLLITALTTVIGLFAIFSSNSDEATESMKRQKTEAERLAEAQRHAQETIANKVADSTSKFVQLAIEWKNLKTEAEQLAWIDNNKNAFHSLGLNIKTVTDANEVFIKQMPKILEVLRIQAEAGANLDLYIEQYKKRQERLNNPTLEGGGQRFAPEITWSKLVQGVATDAEGNRYTREQSDKQLRQMAERYKLTANEDYYVQQGSGVGNDYFDRILYLTEKGKKKVIEAETKAADEIASRRQSEEDRLMNSYLNNYEAKQEEARTKIAQIPQMYDPYTSANPYNTSSTRTTTHRTTTQKTRQQKVQDKKQEATKSSQEYKSEITILEDDIKKLKEANDKLGNDASNKQVQANIEAIKQKEARIKEINDLYNFDDKKDVEEGSKLINETKEKIKEYEQIKNELLDKNKGKNLSEWSEEDQKSFNDATNSANTLNNDLTRMQNILDGLRVDHLKELEDTTKSLAEKVKQTQDAYKLNPTDENKKILDDNVAAYRAALKEFNSYKEEQEKLLEDITDDIEEQFKNNIKNLETQISKIDYELLTNIDLSKLDRAKLEFKKESNNRLLTRIKKKLNEYMGVIDVDTPINVEPYQKEPGEKVLPETVSKGKKPKVDYQAELDKLNINSDLVEMLEAPDFTYLMGDASKQLYEVRKTVKAKVSEMIQDVQNAYNNGLFGDGKEAREQAQKYIDNLNEYLQNLGLEPIEVSLKTDDFREKVSTISNDIGQLGNAVGEAFSAMNEMFKVNNDDKDSKPLQAGKIIAQAIATLALSFAQAMSHEKTIWTWIAGGISGMATLLSMTASLKKLNQSEGYAEGGIIGGHSYYGDKILARVNSNEMITNPRQQKKIWEQMNQRQTIYAQLNPELHGNVTITGDQLNIALTNRQRKISKRR